MKIQDISANQDYTIAITNDFQVYLWGFSNFFSGTDHFYSHL